jgi:lysozyme family protein
MALKNLDVIMEELFKNEGGYVDHPSDPGGATNLGITHKTLAKYRGISPYTKLPKSEIKKLSKAEARAIYEKEYWNLVKGNDLPSGVDCYVMDYAVNSGPSRSVKTLQRYLGVTADGIVGPNTLEALSGANVKEVIDNLHASRLAFLKGLGTWPVFGKGWTNRLNSVYELSKKLVDTKTETPVTGQSSLWAIILRIILKLLGIRP